VDFGFWFLHSITNNLKENFREKLLRWKTICEDFIPIHLIYIDHPKPIIVQQSLAVLGNFANVFENYGRKVMDCSRDEKKEDLLFKLSDKLKDKEVVASSMACLANVLYDATPDEGFKLLKESSLLDNMKVVLSQ